MSPRSSKLESMRATYMALVELALQVRAQSQRSSQYLVDPSAYESWRELGTTCTRQASLRQLMRDFLVEWNEGVGADVEAFWQLVAKRELSVARKQDVVAATLRRGRVLNPPQFYELEDHFEELQECGKISPEEADALNGMLDTFEANPKNFDWVSGR